MENIELTFAALFAFVSLVISYGTFPIKYKGDYLTLEEYNDLELCGNKWCLGDSNRIIEEMSYNDTVKPCEDFNEFVCGTFYRERALNERYEYIGFVKNYELKLDEERHRALKAPTQDDDAKAVKVTKNFYRRCINSRYIEKNSRQEILDYLASFGKFPIQKIDWTEADLNFTKLLTESKLEYFLNFELVLCPSPIDGVEMICLIPEKFHSWERYLTNNLKYTVKDVIDMFELLKFPTADVNELISKFKETSVKDFETSYSSKKYFGSIKDLSSNISQMGINESWIDVINNQMIESLRVSDDAFINVWSFEGFQKRIELFESGDKRLCANLIMIDILYDYRSLFQVYAFENKEYKKAIRTPQRFEICNRLLEKYIPIPTRAIYARRYFSEEAKKAAEVIMNRAITDYIEEIIQLDFVTPETNLTRIKAIQLFAGYPNDMTDNAFLNRIYENLSLTGNETMFETFRELERYNKFIVFLDLSDEDLLTIKIGKTAGENIFSCELVKLDYLYCPATALSYPAFHPKRSQFYNIAMLMPEIYKALNIQGQFFLFGQTEDMAFRSYKKWLQENKSEPNLPGFLLNNQQMFWLALKLKTCVKGKYPSHSLSMYSIKELKGAFNCSVLVGPEFNFNIEER